MLETVLKCSNCYKLMINHRLFYKLPLHLGYVVQCSFIAIHLWPSKIHIRNWQVLQTRHFMLNVYTNAYYSPHRADFSKSPWPHERRQSLSATQLNCPLISAILTGFCDGGPRGGEHAPDCSLFGWQAICTYMYVSGLATKTLFYWRTNNATKWYINLTTVDSYVHFTVDAIMYMYVNNLTGQWFSIHKVENEKFRAVWTVPILRVINGKCAMNRLACEYLSYT